MHEYGFLSLVPAIITILVAITTRKVAWALFFGVAGGAFVTGDYGFKSILDLKDYIIETFSNRERVEIALFVMFIGGMLEMISGSGAYQRFAEKLGEKLNTPRKSRVATWGLSLSLFFDDYANVLISGSSMKTILQKNGVRPAMLAYMIDVIAGFASVMLISTWAAFESGLMVDAVAGKGIEGTATSLFLSSLPFHFYTYIAIALTFMVAWSGKWFGSALDNMELEEIVETENNNGSKYTHVMIPVIVLISLSIVGLFITGIMAVNSDPEIEMNLVNILGNAPTIDVLLGATVISILLAFIMLNRDRVQPRRKLIGNFNKGFKDMISIGMVIMMAGSLSSVSEKLGTGQYISDHLQTLVTPVALGAVIYLIAMLITIATGFSWSSMAIVMPVAVQLAIANNSIADVPLVCAAVISGAITGAQIAPYSDKTVMTAAACGITPIYHAKTQLLQILAAAAAASAAFIIYGSGFNLAFAYIIPSLILFTAHKIFAR